MSSTMPSTPRAHTNDAFATVQNINQPIEPFKESWAHQVENRIVIQLRSFETLSKSKVAEKLNVSIRTLTRKLHQENTSYQSIVKQLQHAMAKEKLEKTNLSISQVAYEVGFKDPHAFSRAFKHWTGINASQFRILCKSFTPLK